VESSNHRNTHCIVFLKKLEKKLKRGRFLDLQKASSPCYPSLSQIQTAESFRGRKKKKTNIVFIDPF